MAKDKGPQTGVPALCVWLSSQHPAGRPLPAWLGSLSSVRNSFQKMQRTVKAGKEFLPYWAPPPVSATFTTGQWSHPLMRHRLQYRIPNAATENTHQCSLRLLNEATSVSFSHAEKTVWGGMKRCALASAGLKRGVLGLRKWTFNPPSHTVIECKPIITLAALSS